MREQIHTWCEQTSFEQVGKRDVECLGWFEATALVPKRVIFLVGREVTGEERKQGEGGGDRAVPGPFKPTASGSVPSITVCGSFLDPVIILKYCVPVFSMVLFASVPLYSTPACVVQSSEPEQNVEERETHSPFTQGSCDLVEGQASYETTTFLI